MFVYTYYRPPDQKDNINNIRMKHQTDILLIGGDLNLPDFNWTNQTVTNNQYPIMTNQSLLEIVANYGLEQIVDYPTYKDNTLDLILAPYSVFKQRCKPPSTVIWHEHIQRKAGRYQRGTSQAVH